MALVTQQFQVIPVERNISILKVLIIQVDLVMHLSAETSAAFTDTVLRVVVSVSAFLPCP
jgi:hypothetical protein